MQFKVTGLTRESYVKAGSKYYQPAVERTYVFLVVDFLPQALLSALGLVVSIRHSCVECVPVVIRCGCVVVVVGCGCAAVVVGCGCAACVDWSSRVDWFPVLRVYCVHMAHLGARMDACMSPAHE